MFYTIMSHVYGLVIYTKFLMFPGVSVKSYTEVLSLFHGSSSDFVFFGRFDDTM